MSQIDDIGAGIRRIEEKLSPLETMAERLDSVEIRVANLEDAINEAKAGARWVWRAAAVSIAMVAGIAAAWDWIAAHLTNGGRP